MPDPTPPHAKVSDLPGWPCPTRVREIPQHENSWGHIPVAEHAHPVRVPVAQDELGYLWVHGDAIPCYKIPSEADGANPGAVVFWTETGIGLWVHPKSLQNLPSISQFDMKAGEWLPVSQVVGQLPAFVTRSGGI